MLVKNCDVFLYHICTPSKFRHNISYRNYDGGPSEDEKNLTICLAVSNIIHEHDRQKDTDGQPATT